MKISIALATYNGGKYLQEQLDSFSKQSRVPDELVVCDDGSIDNTLDILRKFENQAPFTVRIFENPQNLGYVQNFAKAMSLCSGDIIFLSDQDDVWYPNKLDVVVRYFQSYPGCLLVANDSDLADENLLQSGLTISGQLRSSGVTDRQFVNGCGSAISKKFLDIMLPIPTMIPNAHDGWIHDLGYWLGCRKVIPDVLQLYRRHNSNTSQPLAASLSKVSWLDEYKKYQGIDPREGYYKEIEKLKLISERISLCKNLEMFQTENFYFSEKVAEIQKIQAAILRRCELLGCARFVRPWFAVSNYLHGDYDYFQGWKSLIKDILR
ncbi:MAG TPA: glycosyltransferase family 2 protein [Gallionella sp.]|nr:MAG: hypothetical protein A2Z87_12580 [Gallionellales bacterium GWA2_54_124]OGT96414.1 MAG: hypothetical protein A2298_02780 [Gammaproteobacteria bacterium RIFOXYB2_FULL_38_6]HCI53564.1 glycosyltransferase family 2 protein [Gallionella sp.]